MRNISFKQILILVLIFFFLFGDFFSVKKKINQLVKRFKETFMDSHRKKRT